MKTCLYSLIGLFLFATAPLSAADRSFDAAFPRIEAKIEPAEAKPGQVVTVQLLVEVANGWHTYPTVQPEEGASTQITRISMQSKADELIFVGKAQDPPGSHSKADPTLKVSDLRYYEGQVIWTFKAVVSPKAMPGERTLKLGFTKLFACDDQGCLPPRKVLQDVAFKVMDGSVPVDPQYQKAVDAVLTPEAVPMVQPKVEQPQPPQPNRSPVQSIEPASSIIPREKFITIEEHQANLDAVFKQLPPLSERADKPVNVGLGSFIYTAIFWGLISLVTPCVFPMIPITISSFLKKSDQSVRGAVKQALIYCGTIIIVLGISAFALLRVFRELSVDPYMNIALGAIFVFFALSLLGMYDIVLPSSLSRFTGSREKKGGVLGTIFMALTFTIISFTCVAPFLGGFGGMAASGQFSTIELALGGLAFATAFAAPFFVLAMFPALLKKLPKAGNWMNTVKVVMGFLELAAALKFFRTAELRLSAEVNFFTYDAVLGMWVALMIFAGIYLLGLYRLPHDYPEEHISVTRMLIGLGFVSLGLYLLPAMFRTGDGERQRPGGTVYAWVDAFLLPEPGKADLPWSVDLKDTLDAARAERERTGVPQYVFTDFTGVTCTNCKYNEYSVFSTVSVKPLFKKFRLVQMYTDEVPTEFFANGTPTDSEREEEAQANLAFQSKVFGDERLPLYAIFEPVRENGQDKVNIVGVYKEGKINEPREFMTFLRKPFVKKEE